MKKIKSKTFIRRYTAEDDNFWRQHITNFSKSQVSRKIYCKKNGVNYDRFNYWIRKLFPANLTKSPTNLEVIPSSNLLPVQLKSLPESQHQDTSALCTLNLKNGARLQIYNEQALSLILEKWS